MTYDHMYVRIYIYICMPHKITRLQSNQSDGLPHPNMTNSYANDASCMTDVVGGKKHKRGTEYLAEDATIEVSDGWYFIKALGILEMR